MELINATRMLAGYTMGIEPSGREHVVVAVKGTFAIPKDGSEAVLAAAQAPLVMADEFTGEPGFSAPLYEVDYALVKPCCDVLLNACAHAPNGEHATRVRVGVGLGRLQKSFDVVGDRLWQPSGSTFGPGRPNPFVTMPITYDRAFGGSDDLDADPSKHDAYMKNPIGRGYHQVRTGRLIDGRPVANTEAIGDPVTLPWGGYRPQGFGVIGRGWRPRLQYAGTYDQHWIDHVFPFLPPDFDPRYYQAAPADQQIPFPQGGEAVSLLNLTPNGRASFRLPSLDVPVYFFRKRGGHEERQALLDTIVIEPNLRRLMLTWRASLPLRRNMFEIPQIVVGRKSRAWWRARELGKTYYPGLGALVRDKAGEAADA